ncbi:MAG: sigma-70 family RNA polymerase sigma factor [Deltaproteobacteria bacterium]|nr:sigma-70 family RNA polymerase sigma factor [Deltaproteobacteria bacterium]
MNRYTAVKRMNQMDLLRDNRSLLDAFRRGDEVALRQVYFEYAEALFAFLKKGFSFHSRGRNFAFNGYQASWQIEDAVQDIFMRAFKDEARQAYDGLRPYKTYLFTIARNRVMDLFRKEKPGRIDVRELNEVDDSEFVKDGEAKTPEQLSGDRELEEQVKQFLEGLAPDLNTFFQIRFVEGRSLEDAAIALKLTDYRVKRHEQQIRKQFFQFMQSCGYFGGYSFRDRGVEKLIVATLLTYGRFC